MKKIIINRKDFTKNYKLKKDTFIEGELQKVNKHPIHPTDSIICSDKGFVNIDNCSMGVSHWVCFIVKDNKSFYFNSFGGQSD